MYKVSLSQEKHPRTHVLEGPWGDGWAQDRTEVILASSSLIGPSIQPNAHLSIQVPIRPLANLYALALVANSKHDTNTYEFQITGGKGSRGK